MSEKEEKILYVSTHGDESLDKASVPFVLANAALAMDIDATVCLQGNGVYLARKGYTDTMLPPGGFPPLSKLVREFLELGGHLLVCVPCIKERNIDEGRDLIEGSQTTAAGALNVLAMECNAVFVY